MRKRTGHPEFSLEILEEKGVTLKLETRPLMKCQCFAMRSSISLLSLCLNFA